MQSRPSDKASSISTDQDTNSSASFRLEPPEQPQEAPKAQDNFSENNQNSFRELLEDQKQENTSNSIPIASSPIPTNDNQEQKRTTFGDLLNDANSAISDIV